MEGPLVTLVEDSLRGLLVSDGLAPTAVVGPWNVETIVGSFGTAI